MLAIRDRKQQHLFDPWGFLSPKRRERLDQEWPGFFREHILDELPVDKLALAFPSDQGRPTKDLYTVLGVLALQQFHDLTDKQAVDQFLFNIQWHYALDIPEESDRAKYICEKTLWNMRLYAMTLGIDMDVFEAIADMLTKLFQVDTSLQRIDSVHIKSNMARLGRIGIFVRGIERFLVNLKRHDRQLWDTVDDALIQRYQGKEVKGCFCDVKPSGAKKTLSEVASDLYRLVIQFENNQRVADMSTYKQLRRIVKEQCNVQSDGTIQVKAPKQISSDSLQNPSDPDATYSGHKGQGYQVQVMETFTEHESEDKDPAELNLITYVDVEKASESDAQALIPAIEATLEKELAPVELQADALYGSDENCQQARQYDVKVLSPTMGTEKKNSQGFDKNICSRCSRIADCPVKKGKGHNYLRYQKKAMRLAKRRQQENTAKFKERYRWRAGVEATMSQYDRLTGVNEGPRVQRGALCGDSQGSWCQHRPCSSRSKGQKKGRRPKYRPIKGKPWLFWAFQRAVCSNCSSIFGLEARALKHMGYIS
jgi:hypothetical protein